MCRGRLHPRASPTRWFGDFPGWNVAPAGQPTVGVGLPGSTSARRLLHTHLRDVDNDFSATSSVIGRLDSTVVRSPFARRVLVNAALLLGVLTGGCAFRAGYDEIPEVCGAAVCPSGLSCF